MKSYYRLIFVMVIVLFSISSYAQYNSISQENVILYNVSVVGAVNYPGVYMLSPTSRVSEAIRIANAIVDTLRIPQNEGMKASTRNIILKRNNEELHLDIERFLVLGDESQNPYLSDGDIIIVPAQKEHVEVFGSVGKLNGEIELTSGDKITDIIELVFGLMPSIDLDSAEIIRFVDDASSFESISVNIANVLKNKNSDENIALQNDDRIYFREIPQYHEKSFVTLVGEINYPGSYAIENNKTLLSEIIRKAGGHTDDADLANSYLQRESEEDLMEPEYDRLRKTAFLDLSHSEYRYMRNKVREPGNIFAKNFDLLLKNNDAEFDIVLKNADVIVITAKQSVITISGEVTNPGLVSFESELLYTDYIKLAGGLTNQAWEGKIRIIRGRSGNWIKPDENTKLKPGDTIFIPRKERFSYYWPYIKETVAFITGLATSVIVIRSLLTP